MSTSKGGTSIRDASRREPTGGTDVPRVAPHHLDRLLAGRHSSPHSVLGAHPADGGTVIRAMHPDAAAAELILPDGETRLMEAIHHGIFAALVEEELNPHPYRVRFHFPGGGTWERGDPYRFLPTLGELDLHLFAQGSHRRLWQKLGAHIRTIDGEQGVSFAVWAPNAEGVSVVGDFNQWDGRLAPMRLLGGTGVWEIFVPDANAGTYYKYEIRTAGGGVIIKTDPFAAAMEMPPNTASRVVQEGTYSWCDEQWMSARPFRDQRREPMSIYEIHLGSWARVPEESNRFLTYREIAPRLAEYCRRFGFTHVELLPIMEHPFYGSWGYQVSGYFAPTARYGTPDDFRFLVDTLHQAGIGVILDWVPAHFPKDDFALRRFDGTALFEHEDPRLGEHPDWGTLIFNYGRTEVRNFLVANALYWLHEFHVDGLRVDAVASMLYLDYSRQPGQWLRNRHGGRENLEAIDFLREMTETVRTDAPGCFTVAEESTAWPGVTRPVAEGGLGFTFKWNMGWMHDTLEFFQEDPIYRQFHQDRVTFAMMYEYSEHFIMPLSHDEVVHLKGSMFRKMPGDEWQKMANLRMLNAYQYTRPGKQLMFMGAELATPYEWNHDSSLDWHLLEDPARQGLLRYLERLGRLYQDVPAFWRRDHSPDGFQWIDVTDRENSVISYLRRDGDDHVAVILNLTPVPREHYRIGAAEAGTYVRLLSSDEPEFGGGGFGSADPIQTDDSPFHGFAQSMRLTLPPLSAVIVAPERIASRLRKQDSAEAGR